jgi:hypothetical protein
MSTVTTVTGNQQVIFKSLQKNIENLCVSQKHIVTLRDFHHTALRFHHMALRFHHMALHICKLM